MVCVCVCLMPLIIHAIGANLIASASHRGFAWHIVNAPDGGKCVCV